MSDVIWAAAIAGGVGLAGNAATVVATQLQRKGQKELESVKADAERDRLADTHREAERQRRLDVYEQFLTNIDTMIQLGLGNNDQSFVELAERYRTLRGRIELFGSADVIAGVTRIHELLRSSDSGDEVKAASTFQEGFQAGFKNIERQMYEEVGLLIEAMRADITTGMFRDGSPAPRTLAKS